MQQLFMNVKRNRETNTFKCNNQRSVKIALNFSRCNLILYWKLCKISTEFDFFLLFFFIFLAMIKITWNPLTNPKLISLEVLALFSTCWYTQNI